MSASTSLRVNHDQPLIHNDGGDHTSPDEATTSCMCRRWVIIALIAIVIAQASVIGWLLTRVTESAASDAYNPGPPRPLPSLLECTGLPPSLLSPAVRDFISVPIVEITVLRHVRIIDGNGSSPIDNQMITINTTSGKIVSIATDEPSSAATIPSGAHIMDLTGSTVMPGLITMHEHLFYPTPTAGVYVEQSVSAPRLYLAGGVTSMRTSGSINGYTDINTARQIDQGIQAGPHIHATAPYLDGPGNPLTW